MFTEILWANYLVSNNPLQQLWSSSGGGKLLLSVSIFWPVWTKEVPTKELNILFWHHEKKIRSPSQWNISSLKETMYYLIKCEFLCKDNKYSAAELTQTHTHSPTPLPKRHVLITRYFRRSIYAYALFPRRKHSTYFTFLISNTPRDSRTIL